MHTEVQVNWLSPITYLGTEGYYEIHMLIDDKRRRIKPEMWARGRERVIEMLALDNDTDRGALTKMYFAAHRAVEEPLPHLTPRQREAINMHNRALHLGMKKTDAYRYVAWWLEIKPDSAYRLIRRAERREMVELAQSELKMSEKPVSFPIVIEADPEREANIKKKMLAFARDCPGAGMEQCSGNVEPDRRHRAIFCFGCNKLWGDLPVDERPAWLNIRLRDIDKDLRQRAIEALEHVELRVLDRTALPMAA